MTNIVKFNKFIPLLKHRQIFMMIGNGTNNQFRNILTVKAILVSILVSIPNGSVFLYFGDSPNKKNPDVGYLFQLLNELRPDILIYMIQIDADKSWGVPDFVSVVYWHGNYSKKSCMWGGVKTTNHAQILLSGYV